MHSVLFETHTVRRSPARPLVTLALKGMEMMRIVAARCCSLLRAAGCGQRPTSGMHSPCSHSPAPHGGTDTFCDHAA